MFDETFFHGLIRKYVVVFGTLFNDIYVNRTDSSNATIQTIKVPLSYGPKEKFLARLKGDPNLDRPAIVLPRMSFEIVGMQYDSNRKLASTQKIVSVQDQSNLNYSFVPVPYNIAFRLSIMVKNAEDGTRIVEQILPYFTPEWTVPVNLIPEFNMVHDTPFVLTHVQTQDVYEGNFEQRRMVVWELDFTCRAFLYGSIKRQGLIKKAIINLFAPNTSITAAIANTTLVADETITVTPGLTANGEPATNTSSSINYLEIGPDDNYGFIVEFDDG